MLTTVGSDLSDTGMARWADQLSSLVARGRVSVRDTRKTVELVRNQLEDDPAAIS